MNIRAIAVHEIGHAYAGLSSTQSMFLKSVSIVPNGKDIARCVWNWPRKEVQGCEANAEIAIRMAGPITQISFEPDSVRGYIDVLTDTIIQPPEFYEQEPFIDWKSDLSALAQHKAMHIESGFGLPLDQIEKRFRQLLIRQSVRAGILAATDILLNKEELSGPDVTEIISAHLSEEDIPGLEYYKIMRPSPCG